MSSWIELCDVGNIFEGHCTPCAVGTLDFDYASGHIHTRAATLFAEHNAAGAILDAKGFRRPP